MHLTGSKWTESCLAIKNGFVIFKFHDGSQSIRQTVRQVLLHVLGFFQGFGEGGMISKISPTTP